MMAHWVAWHVVPTGLALAASVLLSACGTVNGRHSAPPFRDPAMSLQTARDLIVVGTTNRAETRAALGPATEIPFDSGYAVWVYRSGVETPDADRAEFVILFDPSGVVKKTRLRPSYAGRAP